ncbi:hypothetical protein Poly24_07300 [Rosistilla carotiformis]|uniref:Tetratricopeptide repeat protein n=1 Tax=Rosistilla carotiformis TaxID=2528017 RepID=A0A518JNB6_9BACT|nr:hypothetical protein [Rosistilla carotiformis]QDV67039.1 hypothetical protein Poly24_07300 [Rosistilla carotiformis]
MDETTAENEVTAKPVSPWRMASIAVLALVALGTFATLFATFTQRSAVNVDATLKLAREEFNERRWKVVSSLTNALTASPDWTDDQRQLHAFLDAAAAVQQAFEVPELDARRVQLSQVVGKLKHAELIGFPKSYAREGTLLLAHADYRTGDFAGAAKGFEQGIQNRVDAQRKFLPPLADSQLRSAEYSSAAALSTIDKYLTLQTLDSVERAEGNLLRARILREQGAWDAALAATKQAALEPSLGAKPQLEVTKIQLGRASEMIRERRRGAPAAKALSPEARQIIEDALGQLVEIARTADERLGLDAMLVAGQAQRLLGEYDKALGLFGAVRQNHVDPAVSLAGAIEELEILVDHGTAEECIGTSTYLARDLGDPTGFDPRLISLDEFRRRLSSVVDNLRRQQRFETAIEVTQELRPIFEPADTLRMEAASYAAWGKSHLEQNLRADSTADRATLERSKELHALAGKAYAQAAELWFTSPQYPDLLWDAIQQYDLGHLYQPCLDLLEPYLKYQRRDQLPQGMILQAKALLALRDFATAMRVCDACIAEFPRDSLSYEARILAAQAARELGDVSAAQAFLEANLHDGLLAPDSRAWRDSLLALGELLYAEALANHFALTTPKPNQATPPIEDQAPLYRKNQAVFDAAIRRLEEADTRYPGLRESRRAVYLAAQAHRYAAVWPKLRAEMADTLDSSRREQNLIHSQHLAAAAQTFRKLRSDLNSVNDDGALTDLEQAMLRNCYLGEADALLGLRKYEDAITAYSATINRFINEPIALEALVQQSRCFDALDRQSDVQRILKQAQQILDRIPPEYDDRFAQTTRYDRAGWSQFLQWLLNG